MLCIETLYARPLKRQEKVLSWLAAPLTACIAGTARPDPLALPKYAQHKNRNN